MIVQCKRCQNDGHTRNQCTQQFRCVKCAGTHDYRSCAKKKENGNPAKCALCDGAHPANFTGCRVYLDIVSKRYPTQNGTVPRGQKPLTQHVRTEHTVKNTTRVKSNLGTTGDCDIRPSSGTTIAT